MNERLRVTSFTLVDPTDTAAITTLHYYFDCMVDMTVVGISVAPEKDDADATLDLDDDGTNVITAISCADANVPGTWKSTGLGGGTNTPVHIDAGSLVSFDINSGAVATAFHVVLYWLVGEEST
jgi:hypothetical protein